MSGLESRAMTRLAYPKTVSALVEGADSLLVIAPKRMFDDGSFLEILPEELMRLALDLASDTRPGPLGSAASTLTGAKPRKLGVGVLADEGSRYNAPSRAAGIAKVVAASGFVRSGRSAVLVALDDERHALPALNAIARTLPLYSARKQSPKPGTLRVLAIGPDERPVAFGPEARTTAQLAREMARLVDMPPTDMNPKAFQAEAWRLLTGVTGVKKRQITGDALLRAGLGGIHAVGRTALEAPRMLVATYVPKQHSKSRVALVGKGVTYDTGGLSIKSKTGMPGMKCDMGGAAAVLGAFLVLAKHGCPHELSMVVCLAENAVGPSSYKPDDILTMHSGLTVEINNTDAEGRLLLADGVSYAVRKLGADIVIDAATLTGAQLIATGLVHAAVVTSDEELERTLVEAGRASGDLVHPLPFAPELYQREFKSPVADMRNSAANRANAQASCAAQFVYAHVADTDARWGHVDMAGPAFPKDRATGFGVALLAETVRRV